eukprot:TRINITY_DN5202_c0_g1_i4.p1 TRINITY_DN5202_c0_g1~~TRINITY_DN5202_c0_g1_i4.p1  ORF type:complete len:321 (+),score=54.47 TRINITY_DN5202_c0_g1_i4:208-1170(+)
MGEYKPYAFVGVPRVFGRFYDLIMSNIQKLKGFKRALIDRVIKTKRAAHDKTGVCTHWLYDPLVLGSVRKAMGGRVEVFVSSGAPLDQTILETMKILFSAPFLQGYGQSETAGSITLSYIDDNLPGTIGPPIPCCETKVVDVPDMRYFSTDITDGELTPRGELCVRGMNITQRYFKDPEKTKETIDEDGWLHTGDIAIFNQQGLIRLIDRKKNIFKLQQGEYVAPEKIENILINSLFILQIFVYGDSFQTYIIGVVVPRKETVMEWAKEKNIDGDYEKLCSSKELNQAILDDIVRESKKNKLSGFEIIKKNYCDTLAVHY